MSHKKLIATLGAAFLAVSLQASAKDNIYKLDFHISEAGKAITAPTIVVKENTPSTIETSGAEGYSLSATATDAGPGKIKISFSYKSASNSFAPILIVKEGKEASFKQGDTEVKLIATRRGS